MTMRQKNLITLFKALECVNLTYEEIKSLEWLAGNEPKTVNNIASVINKALYARGTNILPTK